MKRRSVIVQIALVLLSLVFLLPIFVAFSTSLKNISSIFTGNVLSFPHHPQWQNYITVLTTGGFVTYAVNSLIVSIVAAVIQVASSTMAGYALGRIHFRGRSVVFWFVLVTLMLPPEVLVVPMFLFVAHIPFLGGNTALGSGGTGLLNSYGGLIFPYLVSSLGIFLMRQFFLDLPKDLEDAARIDGCSEWSVFRKIFVPLVTPVMSVVFLISFQTSWVTFLWPLLIAKTPKLYTLQVGLSVFQQAYSAEWPLIMAAAIVSSIPIIGIFLFTQGKLKEGVAFAGLKE